VFEQLVLGADSVIGLQLESAVTSERARVEDRVDARVTRDVLVNGRVAIPQGSRIQGSITQVDRGGKVKERARLGIRFHTLVLDDGSTVPLQTDTIYREGKSPARDSAAKIGGGAITGAVLGAIFGGGKGAVIGGAAGAGAGTAATMAGDREAVDLPAGTPLTVRLNAPVSITVERMR
jgi:type IV secretory pathway VirB10-like protein